MQVTESGEMLGTPYRTAAEVVFLSVPPNGVSGNGEPVTAVRWIHRGKCALRRKFRWYRASASCFRDADFLFYKENKGE